MSKKIRNIIIYAVLLIIAVTLVYLANNFGCVYLSEDSPSAGDVKPNKNVTFAQTDFTGDNLDKIEYGSILIYKGPKKVSVFYVSRLIGKSGDLIEIKDGQLYRNRMLIEEKYLKDKGSISLPELLIPKDCVYLLSDERVKESLDSRVLGPVSVSNLVGITRDSE